MAPRPPPRRQANAPLAATGARGRRVLVIEDDADTSEVMRYALQLFGHEVHTTVDGLAGIEAALRLRPDAVLCDVGLPGLDGYEVARRLRAGACGATLVALTGHSAMEDVARARAAGFHHHLGKPVDFAALARLLAGLASDRQS